MKVAVRTALVLVVNVMRIYFYERENSMNREMIKALKNKYIYVDIDGTIAEYRFNNHVNAKGQQPRLNRLAGYRRGLRGNP